MNFKYQSLMDSKGIKTPCPSKDCQEIEREAYRWGHNPIENELNFLPNFIYNDRMNIPIRFNSEEDLKNCGFCSLSLFDDIQAAKDFWFCKRMTKIRAALKYTHILKGIVRKDMGVATNSSPHFEFFEYEGVDLKNKNFIVLEELKQS